MKKIFLLFIMIIVSVAAMAQPYRIPRDLDVAGGIKMRNTTWQDAGVVKFTSGNFWGYNGVEWVRLDSISNVANLTDNILDWDNGAYKPYSSKLDDPGYAYFYTQSGTPSHPTLGARSLYLDGGFRARYFASVNADQPDNSATLQWSDGLQTQTVIGSDSYASSVDVFRYRHVLSRSGTSYMTSLQREPSGAFPYKTELSVVKVAPGGVVTYEPLTISASPVILSQGTANKWLALDANKNIVYMNDPGVGIPAGGFKGEVLAKYSNANYDVVWRPDSINYKIEGIMDSIYWGAVGSPGVRTLFPKNMTDKVRIGDANSFALFKGDSITLFDNANAIYGHINVTGDGLEVNAASSAVFVGEMQGGRYSAEFYPVGLYLRDTLSFIDGTPNKYLYLDVNNKVRFVDLPATAAASGKDGAVQIANVGALDDVDGFEYIGNILSVPGNVRSGVITLAANATTFDVTTCRSVHTVSNSTSTVLSYLTGEASAIGTYITIFCGGVTNATEILDSAPYYLSADWRPNSIGDNITLYIAADNTYFEVSRSNN